MGKCWDVHLEMTIETARLFLFMLLVPTVRRRSFMNVRQHGIESIANFLLTRCPKQWQHLKDSFYIGLAEHRFYGLMACKVARPDALVLESCLYTDPLNPVILATYCSELMRTRQVDRAMRQALRGANKGMVDERMCRVMGELALQTFMLEDCLTYVNTGISIAPRDADSYALLSRCLHAYNRRYDARLAQMTAVLVDPTNLCAYENAVNLLLASAPGLALVFLTKLCKLMRQSGENVYRIMNVVKARNILQRKIYDF